MGKKHARHAPQSEKPSSQVVLTIPKLSSADAETKAGRDGESFFIDPSSGHVQRKKAVFPIPIRGCLPRK